MIKYWTAFFVLFSFNVNADPISVMRTSVDFTPFEMPYVKVLSIEELSSPDDRFGGLSALLKRENDYWSVSDQGHLFKFSNGDFTQAEIWPLRERDGQEISGKRREDAESLALRNDNNFLISFERDHRVVPYDVSGVVIGADLSMPSGTADLPNNGGIEAIEFAQDGCLVMIGEGRDTDTHAPIWINCHDEEGGWVEQKLAKLDKFRPTGLAQLPNRKDQLILLERFYSFSTGVLLRLSLLDIEKWQRGPLLAELKAPLPVDNFEGIIAEVNETGHIVITLLADDNFKDSQRTLVMRLVMNNLQ